MKAAAPVQQLASDQSVMGYIAHVRKNGDQQKLSDHLLGVASLASGNAAKLDLAMVGELLGILHDLGKYSTAFPSEPTPCSANMFLARSMPSVTISMISPPLLVDEFANPILALRCRFARGSRLTLRPGRGSPFHSLAVMSKRIFAVVSGLVSLAGLLWVGDIITDRSYKVAVVKAAPLYSLPPYEYPKANPLIATLQAGQPIRVLRMRYGKDFQAFRVETESGIEGWVIGGEGVQVVSRG